MVTKNLPVLLMTNQALTMSQGIYKKKHVLFVSHKLSPSVFRISFMANILTNFVYVQFLSVR